MRLTVGMACFDDLDGTYFTVQALRTYHDLRDTEILVVDNHPDSLHGEHLRGLHANSGQAFRYIPMPTPTGTAAPRDRVFREATGDVVLCLDSHVLLAPGSIEKLLTYFADPAHARDMASGPMMMDDLRNLATHFEPIWRAEMYGVWGTDPRVLNPAGEPFEVPGQGLGAFAMRRESWVGFNSNFSGFGGEELYVHEKVRRAGGRTVCIPGFRWIHKFGRPGGVPYPLQLWHKVRNYIIGFRELGWDLAPIHKHFVVGAKLTQQFWDELTSSDPPPVEPSRPDINVNRAVSPPCGGCGSAATVEDTLESWYKRVAEAPSDFNEHAPTLRALAEQCDHVTEFGVRGGVSTAALLAAKPKRMASYDLVETGTVGMARRLKGECDFLFMKGDTRFAQINETDLLFIDTTHTGTHVLAELANAAAKVKRYLVFHDTEAPWGEKGEDGQPGVMAAVRTFLSRNPEWTAIRHDKNNHGLTVLSRDDRDKKQPPGTLRKALNFAKALAAHSMTGQKLVSDEVHAKRLELCVVCDRRFHDVCGECGCVVTLKASWADQECPLKKWTAEVGV